MRRAATALSVGLVCALALPASGAIGDSAATSRGATVAPDVTVLFERAVKRVRNTKHPTFSKAVMLEADGLPAQGGGLAQDASEIVRWRFVLDNQKTRNSKFLSVEVSYGPQGFGKVKGHEEPFLEDRRISQPPPMTLAEAVDRLRAAGYPDPFANVVLRRPLEQEPTPPLYIFGFQDGSFVGVNTKSGEVAPLD